MPQPSDCYRPSGLKLAAWPSAYRDAWEEAFRLSGLFETSRPATTWRAATVKKVQKGFGIYLDWLLSEGQLHPHDPPEAILTRQRAEAYRCALIEAGSAPLTIYNRFQELHFALRILVPESDWSWLGQAAKRLRRTARPMRTKLPRLQPVERLERLGRDLMQRAQLEAGKTMYKRALMFRDGLLIAFLARRPLRLKNVAALTLGASLVLTGTAATLAFSRDDVKGKRPLEIPFPAALWEDLRTYLTIWRPYLLALAHVERRNPGNALWISNEGSQMKDHAIHVAIKKRTKAAFSRDLSPHLFRDCAVTSVGRDAPASARLTRDLLGHTTIDTTNQHYNQAKMVEASRRHTAMMESLCLQEP